MFQITIYKHALYAHRYTSTDIVNGEIGMYPLDISIKCRMINYWSSLTMGKRNTKLSFVIYICLLQLLMSGCLFIDLVEFYKEYMYQMWVVGCVTITDY